MQTESRREGETIESVINMRHAQWVDTHLARIMDEHPHLASWKESAMKLKELPVLTRTTTQL